MTLVFGEAIMAENGIVWRRDAEKALDDATQQGKRALVDFTAAPM
jgi:hypothetical protein